jgi:hypothetical protein
MLRGKESRSSIVSWTNLPNGFGVGSAGKPDCLAGVGPTHRRFEGDSPSGTCLDRGRLVDRPDQGVSPALPARTSRAEEDAVASDCMGSSVTAAQPGGKWFCRQPLRATGIALPCCFLYRFSSTGGGTGVDGAGADSLDAAGGGPLRNSGSPSAKGAASSSYSRSSSQEMLTVGSGCMTGTSGADLELLPGDDRLLEKYLNPV